MSLITHHAARVLELANAALEALAALEEAEADALRDLECEEGAGTMFEDEEQSLEEATAAVSAIRHAATRALEEAADGEPKKAASSRGAKRPRRGGGSGVFLARTGSE